MKQRNIPCLFFSRRDKICVRSDFHIFLSWILLLCLFEMLPVIASSTNMTELLIYVILCKSKKNCWHPSLGYRSRWKFWQQTPKPLTYHNVQGSESSTWTSETDYTEQWSSTRWRFERHFCWQLTDIVHLLLRRDDSCYVNATRKRDTCRITQQTTPQKRTFDWLHDVHSVDWTNVPCDWHERDSLTKINKKKKYIYKLGIQPVFRYGSVLQSEYCNRHSVLPCWLGSDIIMAKLV